MTSEKDIIRFNRAKLWTDNGVLFCQIKNTNVNLNLEIDTLDCYINAVVKLCNGRPMPFLIDIRSSQGTILNPAAKLLAGNNDLKKLRLSEAFIINSIKMKLLINSYKRIFEPVTPFQIFDNLKDGLEYCIKIKNDYYDGER